MLKVFLYFLGFIAIIYFSIGLISALKMSRIIDGIGIFSLLLFVFPMILLGIYCKIAIKESMAETHIQGIKRFARTVSLFFKLIELTPTLMEHTVYCIKEKEKVAIYHGFARIPKHEIEEAITAYGYAT